MEFGLSGTRKVKPFWILMKQEMVGWQWQQLDRMQMICISLQTVCQHLVTQFLQAGCSS